MDNNSEKEPVFFERYIKSKGYHSFHNSGTYQTGHSCHSESVADEKEISEHVFSYNNNSCHFLSL